jgi:hypothetical protein
MIRPGLFAAVALAVPVLLEAPLSAQQQLSVGEIVRTNKEAVVFIKVSASDANGVPKEAEATGFLVSAEGHVITARHILPWLSIAQPQAGRRGLRRVARSRMRGRTASRQPRHRPGFFRARWPEKIRASFATRPKLTLAQRAPHRSRIRPPRIGMWCPS